MTCFALVQRINLISAVCFLRPHHGVPRRHLQRRRGGEGERTKRAEHRVEPAAAQGGGGEDDLQGAAGAGEQRDGGPPRQRVRASHQALLHDRHGVGRGPTQGGHGGDEGARERLERQGGDETRGEAGVRHEILRRHVYAAGDTSRTDGRGEEDGAQETFVAGGTLPFDSFFSTL